MILYYTAFIFSYSTISSTYANSVFSREIARHFVCDYALFFARFRYGKRVGLHYGETEFATRKRQIYVANYVGIGVAYMFLGYTDICRAQCRGTHSVSFGRGFGVQIRASERAPERIHFRDSASRISQQFRV